MEEPEADFAPTASVEVRLSQAIITVEVDTRGSIDVAAERARLEKELSVNEKELETTGKKLSNEAFLVKAPAAVVERIRTRQQVAQSEIERISGLLAALPAA